jgi:molybdate transport system substrate-binding protein
MNATPGKRTGLAWNRAIRGLIAFSLLILAPIARADAVTVFAAASTNDALSEVIALYEAERGNQVRASFASSSTLARQIESGAPADLYLSANQRWMDYLAERQLVAAGSRRRLMSNRLVLVAPEYSAVEITPAPGFPLAEALGDRRLAMGDPDHVPAGIYGKQALQSLGVWEKVEARIARAADVRGALALVARGEVAAGITYATDAAVSDAVRIVAEFPSGSHPPVTYEVALVSGRADPVASEFLDFLTGTAARSVLRRHGFSVDE